MGQEPGTDDEIQEFCKTTYDVTFPVLSKVDVNGENSAPLYEFLRAEAPGDIQWNFTKFLIGREGEVVKRYEPQVTPEEIQADLAQYL